MALTNSPKQRFGTLLLGLAFAGRAGSAVSNV